jgi:glycosyltransferase involved in cell wall biosynthesis
MRNQAAAVFNQRLIARGSSGLDVKRHPSQPRIAIGICTRQRNALLRRLLRSLWQQPIPERYAIEVIIVDNNDAPTVTPGLLALPPKFPLTIIHEAKPGLVTARNRLLDAAVAAEAEWMLGLDDDTWAEPDWLAQFIVGLETLDAEIIVAAKRFIYGKDTSPYLLRFSQEQEPAGAGTKIYSTTNYAINRRVFAPTPGLGLRFEPTLNQSGGEDFEFMLRAKTQHGITAVNWPLSVVSEEMNGQRAKFAAQLKRQHFDQLTRFHVTRLHRVKAGRGSVFGNALKAALLTNRHIIFGTADCLRGLAMLAVRRPNARETIGAGLISWARAAAIVPFVFGKTAISYGAKVNAKTPAEG